MNGVEVQHVTLVGDDSTSLRAEFMRCGSTHVTMRRNRVGLSETAPRQFECHLSNREVRAFGQLFSRLADLLDANGGTSDD